MGNQPHARIQEFSSEGVQVSLTKKSSDNVIFFFFFFFFFFFCSPQLILQKSNGQFQKIYHFSRFQRGSNISRGVQLFPGGGGVQLLIPF